MRSSLLSKVAPSLAMNPDCQKIIFLLVLKSVSIKPIDLYSALRAPNQTYPPFLSVALLVIESW